MKCLHIFLNHIEQMQEHTLNTTQSKIYSYLPIFFLGWIRKQTYLSLDLIAIDIPSPLNFIIQNLQISSGGITIVLHWIAVSYKLKYV